MKRTRDESDEGNVLKNLSRLLFKINKTEDPRQKKIFQNQCADTLMFGVKCGYSIKTMKNIILKYVELDKVPEEYKEIIGKF